MCKCFPAYLVAFVVIAGLDLLSLFTRVAIQIRSSCSITTCKCHHLAHDHIVKFSLGHLSTAVSHLLIVLICEYHTAWLSFIQASTTTMKRCITTSCHTGWLLWCCRWLFINGFKRNGLSIKDDSSRIYNNILFIYFVNLLQ